MLTLLAQTQRLPGAGNAGAPPNPLSDLNIVFGNVVTVLIGFAAIALFIMLVIGGFMYITAGGDSKKAEGAKNTITYGIYGVVLVVIAFLIIQAIAVFTGVQLITGFSIFQ